MNLEEPAGYFKHQKGIKDTLCLVSEIRLRDALILRSEQRATCTDETISTNFCLSILWLFPRGTEHQGWQATSMGQEGAGAHVLAGWL